MKKRLSFYVESLSRVISASQNQTILDSLIAAGIDIDHSCGGNGTCGTCRVRVENKLDLMASPNDVENEIRGEMPFDKEERLACQNFPIEGLSIRIREKKIN